IVGMHFHGRIKDFKDFAIGGKPIHTTIVTATAAATIIGAEFTFGFSEQIYNIGIVTSLLIISKTIKLSIISKVIGPRMARLKNMYTMGDIWHEYYGKNGRIFCGVLSVISGCVWTGVQVTVFGHMAKMFFGVDEEIGAIVSIITIAIYCYYGGVKAVIMTDVIQILIIMIIFPILCYIAVINFGGMELLLTQVQATNLMQFTTHPKLNGYVFLALLYMIPDFDPAQFHRLIIARTGYRIKRTMLGVGVVSIMFYLIILVMSLIAAVSNQNLHGDEVVLYTINNFAPNGVAIAGYVAIIAVVMSTIDSYLNSTGIIIVQDIIKPLTNRYIDDEEKINISKKSTLLIAVIAGVVALKANSIMSLAVQAMSIWHPVIVVPMFACLLDYKTSFEVVLKAAGVAIFTLIFWSIFNLQEVTEIVAVIPAMVANLISFITFRHMEMNAPVVPKDNELVAGVKAIRQKAIKVRSASMGQENSIDINYHLTQIEQKAEAVIAKINNHPAEDEQENQDQANTQARPGPTNKNNTETIAVDADGHPTYQTTIQHVNKLSSQITQFEHRARSILNKINRELAEVEDRKKAKDKVDS
ncbi:MAG: sodium:solute symporter family protein, partial [Pseudomonadota bacterium]